ncbi:MAG: hypothetical protein GY903_29640 [Fuerstiella sp.]|nr:hypothetical protein [Fuerstiella sp.]
MRRSDDTDQPPENKRRSELASIFAAAILQLQRRISITGSNVSEKSETCLEVPPETVLSGHHG